MNTPDRFIRRRERREITGLSEATLYRLECQKKFPARIQLTPGRVGWSLQAVLEWCSQRQSAARAEGGPA